MRKILWLTSWYPNATDVYSGDFIQRHAEAVAIFQAISLVYAGKVTHGLFPSAEGNTNVQSGTGHLSEHILFYHQKKYNLSFYSKIQSFRSYIKLHFEFIKNLRDRNELPDLVHVHVAMKAGLIALYLKRRYKIPYVLTEHWSGYYQQSSDSLFKKSFFERFLTKQILRNAEILLPVSNTLGEQIRNNWATVPYLKIANVVNTLYFYPSKIDAKKKFRFIHISSLLYPKNPEAIIRAFSNLLNQGFQAELALVGKINQSVEDSIQSCGLNVNHVIITGKIPYAQVGDELRKSSSLILFSYYENMPCVMLEALCTGIPVIASKVGGIPEVVGSENGILVNPGDEAGLLDAMKKMIQTYQTYNHSVISQKAAAQFSYETIGRQITDVYRVVLEKK
jgi:glycosyltransferase involved in cell wall biosynthesis